MAEQIRDGTGQGYLVKIDSDNHLHTKSESTQAATKASLEQNAYNINTGIIALTTGSESALFYLKNNEDKDLVIETVIYIIGNTTSGLSTANHLVNIVRNPTAGTIVTEAANVSHNQNRNFGSSKTLLATAYKGGEGKTFTDGTVALSDIYNNEGLKFISTASIILQKGSSMGINFTPKSGNTTMDVQIATSAYLNSEDLD